MRVCIYGAGAVGGHLAARLVSAGQAEVSAVARGAHLEALKTRGILLHSEGREFGGRLAQATDDPSTLPPQDLVVVTLKAPAQPGVAELLSKLVAPNGMVLFAQNGIPWWWNYGLGRGATLPLLDPKGELWRLVGGARVLGAVVNSSNAVTEPGVIVNAGGKRWQIGEPEEKSTPRLQSVIDLFRAAGLDAVATNALRREIWRKLCTNISANPIAALTRQPAERVEGLAELAMGLIEETVDVAAALGWDLRGDVDAAAIVRPAGGRNARPSMLQDVEAGRALEVDAILGQVQAFGRDAGVATPRVDVVLPLLRGLDAALREARVAAGRPS